MDSSHQALLGLLLMFLNMVGCAAEAGEHHSTSDNAAPAVIGSSPGARSDPTGEMTLGGAAATLGMPSDGVAPGPGMDSDGSQANAPPPGNTNSTVPDAAIDTAGPTATPPDPTQADAGAGIMRPPARVTDLSDQVLATWGSSVCDGFGVSSSASWASTLARQLEAINGPGVSQVSTGGHSTASKASPFERAKVRSADFVVVCLSLGNQGLGSTATEARAEALVDSYLGDIFTDADSGDGDPESLVTYIESLGAYPIVTLVYPMANYNTMHCRALVDANIQQQSYGIPTINHLSSTNAGNAFDDADCKWGDGRNGLVDVQSDARHPNESGHAENFYAFPPDLPFALASGIPFPTRPDETDYHVLPQAAATGGDPLASAPIRYTPEYALHNYTMQFGFRTSNDGTLAAVDLGMNGFVTLELRNGVVHLVAGDASGAVRSAQTVTDDAWHDVAVTYSYVRQKLVLYVDGALVTDLDARNGARARELFPQDFVLGGPATSGRAAAPQALQLRDFFVNRAALHAREVEERAKTDWVGAGSLDVYAPLRATAPEENRAQTLQTVRVRR